jgi:serine/threonine protein kinase
VRGRAPLAAGLVSVERIACGGSSEVWRATSAGRTVALKMLKPELRERSGAGASLTREHELLAVLAHPHVVSTLGLVELEGVPAIALEYLGGGDLASLVGAEPRHWLRAAAELAAALGSMHERGYVHRDVKTRNVLFDAADSAKLIDFGSVLPIGSPAVHGGATAAHRPPGRPPGPVTPADDCYAFAALLYELFAARLPYGPAPSEGSAPPPWPLAAAATPALRRLADLVLDALLHAGDVRGGLSEFLDVLESAATTH